MFSREQQIGNYKLIRKLGKGGFGEVWLAVKRSQLVTKKVAIKLPYEEQINLEAIRKEASLWEQSCGHSNILNLIDADIHNGQVFIVSEYAEEGSLYDKLKKEGKLPLQKALEITIGILNGLEYLHNKRIIHRDIKPQNILMQGETPRLADFGISRTMQTSSLHSTQIVGTPSYMSPESFEGKRNVQTDLWSVGIVLYQLLKGNLPFSQENPSERMFAIMNRDFAPLPDEIPSSLKQVIKRTLEKLPHNRYQTAGQMRDALVKILNNEKVFEAAPSEPEIETRITPKIVPPQRYFEETINLPSFAKTQPVPRFRRLINWSVAAIILCLFGIFGIYLLSPILMDKTQAKPTFSSNKTTLPNSSTEEPNEKKVKSKK